MMNHTNRYALFFQTNPKGAHRENLESAGRVLKQTVTNWADGNIIEEGASTFRALTHSTPVNGLI